jgi:hypothetical protein
VVVVKSQFKRLFAKRTVRTLFFSFFFYCFITAVIHYFAFNHPHPDNPEYKHVQDLAIALWANVIFAGAFGLLTAVVSLFRPEEDSLDKRLGYLYPRSSTLTGDARSQLGKNAMKLAAPAVRGDLHFVVEHFDPSKKAFWLTVYVSFTLRNILQDEYYEDEIELHVAPDEVPGVLEIGRLIESTFACSESDPQRIVHDVSKPISAENKRYQAFVEVKIPPCAEAIHSYSFNGWALEKNPFQFHAQRYSEGIQVRVSNRSSHQVTCELSRGTNNPTLRRDRLDARAVPSSEAATLKEGLVLDGNRDNIELVLHL